MRMFNRIIEIDRKRKSQNDFNIPMRDRSTKNNIKSYKHFVNLVGGGEDCTGYL